MHRLLLLVVACLAALALAGCGGGDSNTSSKPEAGGNNPGSLGPPTILTLTYKNGKGNTKTARLTCTENQGSSGTGYLADRADETCKQIGSVGKLLIDGPDETKACTQQYGGPQTLELSGRVDFKTVNRTFARTNGCQIADFAKLAALLPPNAPGGY